MKNLKKITAAFFLLALINGSLWWYWEKPMPLDSLVPDEQWKKMDLERMRPDHSAGDLKFEHAPLEDVLAMLPAIRVTRAEGKRHQEDDCFRITLYKAEPWPTVMYVSSTGRVDIATDMQFDNWKHYEGGEALYLYLSILSQTLSGTLPVE